MARKKELSWPPKSSTSQIDRGATEIKETAESVNTGKGRVGELQFPSSRPAPARPEIKGSPVDLQSEAIKNAAARLRKVGRGPDLNAPIQSQGKLRLGERIGKINKILSEKQTPGSKPIYEPFKIPNPLPGKSIPPKFSLPKPLPSKPVPKPLPGKVIPPEFSLPKPLPSKPVEPIGLTGIGKSLGKKVENLSKAAGKLGKLGVALQGFDVLDRALWERKQRIRRKKGYLPEEGGGEL